MALSLDIKVPDLSDWAKDSEKIADNTEKIGEAEVKATKEIQKSSKLTKAMGDSSRRALADHKKTTVEEKKQNTEVKESAINWKLVGGTILAAGASVLGLGAELLKLGHDAERSKSGAKALLDAYSDGHGAEMLKLLDTRAKQLGERVDDVRADFIKFREAGMTNQMSMNLINMQADLKSTGMSAEDAAKQVELVASAGRDVAAQRTAWNELEKAFPKLGDGAAAVAHSTESIGAALNRLHDTALQKLGEVWAKVGPSIGTAVNALSNFLIKSPEAKEAFTSIAEAIKDMAKSINASNLKKVLGGLKETAIDIRDAFRATSEAFKAITGKETRAEKSGTSYKEMLADELTADLNEQPEEKSLTKYAPPTFQKSVIGEGPQSRFTAPDAGEIEFNGSGFKQGLPKGQQHASLGGATFNINVMGNGGDPHQLARSIRQEIQLYIQSQQLSQGLA